MGWFLAVFFGAILGMLIWRQRNFVRHWRHLERILEDLAEGTEPRSFVFLDGGRFTQMAGILERLADAQERLRRRRSREEMNLQTILASMEEGVLVVDRQHIVRLANPALVRLFQLGFDPVGQTVLQALRGAEFDTLVNRTLADWQPQAQQWPLDYETNARSLAVNSVPMRDASGEEGVVVIVRDITRLKQLEDMRREFVANVSHELRTPLSIFRGYLENLRDNPDLPREELVSTIGILERHSFRLNALVEDLLTLARLESRNVRMRFEPLDVRKFLAEMVEGWKLRSAHKQIGITLQVPAELPFLVVDELRLEQVMSNLLDNAIKYTPEGGAVLIQAALVGEEMEFLVKDNGPGLLASDLPHIFERFYRADKARSREHGGTGLGLSIVKHIVQAHGGCVEAESVYGQGTGIRLRFPLQAQLVDEVESV